MQHFSRTLFPALLASFVCPLLSCQEVPETKLNQPTPPAVPVGIAAIKARGSLRLLTRNNGNTYFVHRGERLGFDYELAQRFARRLGVSLEVIVPRNHGDLIPMLIAGEGDIAGAALNVTPLRSMVVEFARPYALTHIRVLWRKGSEPVGNAEQLSGKLVHVRGESGYYTLLSNLNSMLELVGQPPIDIVIEDESLETEQLITDVAEGRIAYTLCDYHICLENSHYLPQLVVGPPVSTPKPIAWAVHKAAPDLLQEVNEFFDGLRKGDLPAIYKRYYEEPRRREAVPQDEQVTYTSGRLSPFDALFKEIAQSSKIDWRLLASIAYQESQFDPTARKWDRGRGLFGMAVATARKHQVRKLKDPRSATKAAVAELSALRNAFEPYLEEVDRLRMTLAAYHSGLEHVKDARLLAAQQQTNADKWESVSDSLKLLAKRKHASKAKHGYVRGSEVVSYVDQIWERYRAYRHAGGERDE